MAFDATRKKHRVFSLKTVLGIRLHPFLKIEVVHYFAEKKVEIRTAAAAISVMDAPSQLAEPMPSPKQRRLEESGSNWRVSTDERAAPVSQPSPVRHASCR